MGIICIFKCSSFHCASDSQWCSRWPCRSLAEEEWPGQRAGCSCASAAASVWMESPSSPARTCIRDPIYDMAEGFKPGCGLWQLRRHKWCSNWVENRHLLSPEQCDSTHCAFGDCGCGRKTGLSWSFAHWSGEGAVLRNVVFCIMYIIHVFFWGRLAARVTANSGVTLQLKPFMSHSVACWTLKAARLVLLTGNCHRCNYSNNIVKFHCNMYCHPSVTIITVQIQSVPW